MVINIQVGLHGEDVDGGWEIWQYIEKHVCIRHWTFLDERPCLTDLYPTAYTRDVLRLVWPFDGIVQNSI